MFQTLKPKSIAIIVGTTLVSAVATLAFAEPAAKTAISMGKSNIGVTNNVMPYTKVYSATLKTANQSELLVGLSLECQLFTQTQVKGKKGDTTQATAHAGVKAKVKVDGQEIYPPYVHFCDREQTLTATLGGVLEECTFDVAVDDNGEGTATFDKNSCTFSDEMIDLAMKTASANHFNFISPNVGSGMHTIEVYVAIDHSASGEVIEDISERDGFGSASAWAAVGYGSLVVDEVRLVHGDDGIN
jgi:hypothetical protein